MLKNKLFFSFAFILFCSFFCSGQNLQLASVIHTVHKINSQILGEERTIPVCVPANYPNNAPRFSKQISTEFLKN